MRELGEFHVEGKQSKEFCSWASEGAEGNLWVIRDWLFLQWKKEKN